MTSETVKKAMPSMIDDIVKPDKSIIGLRKCESIIRLAVENGQCYVIEVGNNITAFGRLMPAFADGKRTWTEELFETPYEKRYPDDEPDYTEYINNPDKYVKRFIVNGDS